MLTKKFTSFVLLSLLCSSSFIFAGEILLCRPEAEEITKSLAQIKREEQSIAIKRYAFFACLVGAGCYAGYKLFWQAPAVPQPNAATLDSVDAKATQAVALGQENKTYICRIAEKLDIDLSNAQQAPVPVVPAPQPPATTPAKPAPGFLLSSYNWCKSQSGQILQLTAATALFYAFQSGMGPVGKYFNRFDGFVDKWLSHVFHDDTLAWYLESHTHFEQLLPELQTYADDSIAFADVWKLLIHELEGTLAFMQLQAESFEQKNSITAQRAVAIAQTIMQEAAWAATTLEQAFIAGNTETITTVVAEYQEKLKKSIEHFKFIELFKEA